VIFNSFSATVNAINRLAIGSCSADLQRTAITASARPGLNMFGDGKLRFGQEPALL
jgi:hypothetical protein